MNHSLLSVHVAAGRDKINTANLCHTEDAVYSKMLIQPGRHIYISEDNWGGGSSWKF